MAKPDNRSNNVDRLQEMTQNTVGNLEEARETLENSNIDSWQRAAIKAKNKRREESIRAFRSEIKDEFQDNFKQ